MRHFSLASASILLTLLGALGLSTEVSALVYPVGVPTGEIAGGAYRTYFDNIFSSEMNCYNMGKVVGGFNSSGVPFCVAPSVATSFFLTGQTLGDTIRYNGTDWIRNNLLFNNGTNIGIGTTTPGAKLEVAGQIKITGGTPGVGKILVSDAAGLASWVAPGSASNQVCPGTGTGNTCYGIGAGAAITTGYFNTSEGYQSLYVNTSGYGNTAHGAQSLYSNTTGYRNTANSTFALFSNTIGNYNTADGFQALFLNVGGNYNTAFGLNAGYNLVSGDNNIFIGYNTQPNISTTSSNQLNIGNWIYGNGGSIGIGVPNPGAKLEVAGQVKITGGTPGAGKVLTSDATGLATWSTMTAGNVYATGILGGVQNYVTKFGTGGNGIYPSQIFDNGTNIGIGTATPGAKLEVAGQVKITGGTLQLSNGSQGSGKVLISDPNGVASWTDASMIGVGGFNYAGFSDYASLNVISKASDRTDMVFQLADNAIDGGDRFVFQQDEYSNVADQRYPLVMNGLYAAFDPRYSLNFNSSTQNYASGSIQSATMYMDYATRKVGIGTITPVTTLDLSGSLSQSANGVREYTNVAFYSEALPSLTGTIQIALPNSWTSTMLRMRIVGYDYSGGGAWEVIVGGYNYSSTPSWINTSAEIRGKAPFTTVRLAHNGTKNVVLLGNTTTVWNYPKIVVREVTAGHANQNIWGEGWTIGRILSEASITGSVTPFIAPPSPLSLLQGGNSFGSLLSMGTNDSQPVAIETNGLERMRVDTNGNVGIGTSSPAYKLDVYGNGRFTGNLTVSGSLIVDKLVNRTVNNISISGSLLPDAAAPLAYRDIGSNVLRWNNLYVNGQVTIGGGTPGVGKVLTSDANGLATWSSILSGATATGIVGGTQNYIPKFGTGGTGLYSSQIFDNGTNVGIGTISPSSKFTIDSGIANISGLKFVKLTLASPTYTGGALGLGVDASGNIVPIANGDVVVYDGIGRNLAAPSPNPDVANRKIAYDFNRYFLIPTKQSFVVSDGNGAGYNAPYFKEDGTSGICSWNGASGTSPYDCATADPYTGLSASPNNSFTMTARGASYGYQIALGARGDAPLFARSGKWYNSTSNYGSGLYLADGTTPTPWQKVLTVPANHIEYFYVNIGYNSQLQAISGGGNIGMGTSTPDMRLVLAYSGAAGSTAEMMRIERGLKGADANMVTTFGTPYLLIGGKETKTNSIQTIGFGYNSGSSYQPAEIGLVTTNTAGNTQGDLVFATRNGTTNVTPTERMRIFGNGSIGIGTSTVASRFEVWSGATTIFHMRGTNNIGMGIGSVRSLLSGNANTGFGNESLYTLTTGYSNSAFGHQALRQSTTGYNNSAFGKEAMYNDGDGTWNTALGYQALRSATSSDYNVAIGGQTLYTLGTGTGNIAIGHNALYGATTSTSNNIAIGYMAGSGITTGWNNIIIGNGAQARTSTGSNQLNIGNWIYGNGGNIGIGSPNPGAKLEVAGLIKSTLNGTAFLQGGDDSTLNDVNIANTLGIMGVQNPLVGSLQLGSSTGAYIYGNGGGNIGIATTAPGAKFDINGTFKLGTAGTVTTAAGTCTIASTAITTTATTYACTGVPASTAVALSCSAAGAFTTPGTTALYCRANGTAGSVTCNTTVANTNAMTYKCMWMQ